MEINKLAGLEPANVWKYFEEICSMPHGSGNTKINFICAILDGLILRIFLSLFFGLYLGMEYRGFWLGSALSGFTPTVISLHFDSVGDKNLGRAWVAANCPKA
jgi:hypothetical protein